MKAVILAGGQGTRLKELTQVIPKPMIPIAGKPLLEHHINILKKYNVTEIYITVNYLKDEIIHYFGDGDKFGVRIHYYEETIPLGTVGGVKALENKLTEDFLVIYGDVLFDMNLNKLIQFHKQNRGVATLVLHPNDHPYDSDLVDLEKGIVKKFISKPHDLPYYKNMVNAGVYVFTPEIFSYLKKDEKADFGKDIFPALVKSNKVLGYNTSEYLKDMGTPDRLDKVTNDWNSGKIKNRNIENKQVAIFLDRDGVINDDTEFIHKPEDFHLLPNTSKAIKKINQSDYLSIVVTNQSVVARGLCTMDELNLIHQKMETDLGKDRAYLDEIYFCPHHPDKGYEGEVVELKVDCECRKPKSGMFFEARDYFNIDLEKSYLIGDHERDIIAGKNAGCTTIGVATGKGFRNTKTKSDFFFMDIEEAVNFIIDNPYEKNYEEIIDTINQSSKKPFVILVGGNSQSGKTTFASGLKRYLKLNEKSVLKIQLDDWIIPKEKRGKSHDPLHNFNAVKSSADIKRILAGGRIELEGYARALNQKPTPEKYQYTNEEVVIIEGVVALSIPYLNTIADLKIFKSIGVTEHKERVLRYLQWKGYSKTEANEIYTFRKEHEYTWVNSFEKFAEMVV